MQRYKIFHRTYYNFSTAVQLEPHALRLRPREGHQLRVESMKLTLTPDASLRWHRDAEDNAVAIATFHSLAAQVLIENEVVIQQYHEAPLDFLVADDAVDYPFAYGPEDREGLAPYIKAHQPSSGKVLKDWMNRVWDPAERIQTYALLQRLNLQIHKSVAYQLREEPGVQSVGTTLDRGTGSCRDMAHLFMEAARQLGFASRFVSGYLHAPPSAATLGATHAWAEVYLPGAGWTGFDPSIGALAGTDHIPVAVARLPESVPPVSGSFIGSAEVSLDVGVWVSELR